MAKTRVAINGFGRIGKTAFKIIWSKFQKQLEVVAINDPNSAENVAHSLRYDSVYRDFEHQVSFGVDHIKVDGHKIFKFTQLEPQKLPWKKLKVDVVLECTGVFTTKEKASWHAQAGAKVVIISAPAKGDGVGTYVMGVNHQDFDVTKERVISNASCTTNCIAPIMQILEENFGIEKAMMSTIHGYTADQNLVDGSHRDPRRGRSAGLNIVPTSTGAARVTSLVVPQLKGIFDGMAFRVPVPVGSVSDITAVLKRAVTKEEVNNVLSRAASGKRYKGILAVTSDPVVSSDIIGCSVSALVDLQLTTVLGGNMVKVVVWYDNEYGYSHRLVEQAVEVSKQLRKNLHN